MNCGPIFVFLLDKKAKFFNIPLTFAANRKLNLNNKKGRKTEPKIKLDQILNILELNLRYLWTGIKLAIFLVWN